MNLEKPADLLAHAQGLSTKLAGSSVRVVYSTARSMFKAAVEDRVIASSPCVRVRLPSSAAKTLTIPPVETVHAIGGQLPVKWRAVVYVSAGPGLRPGEVFGLAVSDVDFLRRMVRVETQLDEAGRLVPLKTDSSYRSIPLPETVAVELARHLSEDPQREGLVFVGHDGQPVKRNTFTKVWRRAAVTAGAGSLRPA